ncbi:MAG: hypothetical protein L6R40_006750 [Gallowayella cf. fulva]|nr:MAG: hypothetical protein L6R40_006750 [Xanthomendoza cf. fulva]
MRKAFYSAGEDEVDDELPEDFDEEEQENLIAQLKKQDEANNILFRRIFLAMPVISVVTFLPTLLAAPLFRMRLISFLSISSLLFTAYTLIRVPSTGATRKQTVASDPLSPLHQYGPYLNGALSMLIGLNGFVFDYKNIGHGGFWLLCLLPNGESVYLDCEASTLGDLRKLVVFLVSLFARRTMLDVDFDSLEKLKYPYKGA